MKEVLSLLLIGLFSVCTQAQIVIEGSYCEEDLYVQNPFSGTGTGFCTTEILINGKVIQCEINSSAYRIPLTDLGYKRCDKLVIEIRHDSTCSPRLLHQHYSPATVEVKNLEFKDSVLAVVIDRCCSGLVFFSVQQYKWGGWITVGELDCLDSCYFKPILESGTNKFRLSQAFSSNAEHKYSNIVEGNLNIPEVILTPTKKMDYIYFSRKTMFKVEDSLNNVVIFDFGEYAELKNLPKGSYTIYYDLDSKYKFERL